MTHKTPKHPAHATGTRRYAMLLLFLFICGAAATSVQAQITPSTPWIWIHGEKAGDQYSVNGTKGTPATANTPGSITQGIGWATSDGNLWLFGGYGNTSSANGGLNSLWKYTPSTDSWTWVKGDDITNRNGVYAPMGTASASSQPGAGRRYASTWTDSADNLWMFGGFGYDGSSGYNRYLNDLWKYSPATNQWTWMKGDSAADQSGHYGTKGVAAAANNPGGRNGAVSWNDGAGNFWLFGGFGFDANGITGYLNDLWKYNVATNEWTWVSGDNTANMAGVYGTKGTPATANKPGGRQMASGWMDADGNLWLFGGEISTSNYLNDLWRFNPTTGQWTWMTGSNTTNVNGTYGTQGTAAAANTPGGRYAAAAWTDQAGNFWLLGGSGFAATVNADYLNDFWRYDPATNQWTWMKGTDGADALGIYGTKGQGSATSMPGARDFTVYWTDSKGMFWLFGGDGLGEAGRPGTLNDLWQFDYCIEMAQADSITGERHVCGNTTGHTYTVPAVHGAVSYTWQLPAGWTGSSNSNTITVTSGTTGGTIGVVVNGQCDTSAAKTFTVEVYPIPQAQISVSGFVLSTMVPYVSYQWFLNGNAIAGATAGNYTVTQNGDYTVAVVDSNGCKDTSDIYKVTNAGIEDAGALAQSIQVYPNPATDQVTIQSPVIVDAVLTDISGRAIKQVKDARNISVKDIASGVYLLRITNPQGTLIKVEKIVKQDQ